MVFSKTITLAALLGSSALSLSFARADEPASVDSDKSAPISELIITAQKRRLYGTADPDQHQRGRRR